MAMVDAIELGDLVGKCNLGISYLQGLIFPVFFFYSIACTHLEIVRLPIHLCKFLNVIPL
ncbi:hypothetical protein ACE6H2_002552 [Prunus campanulata]